MSFDRRSYQREYARRRRAAALAAARQGALRCPKKLGRAVCGGRLETVVDRMTGRTAVVCPWCARQARGVCRDCSAPVAGRRGTALRCAVHTREARRAAYAKHVANNRREINLRVKRAYQTDPAVRARRNEYKRLWRRANPEKVRRQKRRAALRQPARVREYMAGYRAERREHYRQTQYERDHGTRPARPCVAACGATVQGRAKKCDACKRRDRQAARAAIAARMGYEVAA